MGGLGGDLRKICSLDFQVFFGFGSTFINGSSSGWWLEMLSIVDFIVFSDGLKPPARVDLGWTTHQLVVSGMLLSPGERRHTAACGARSWREGTPTLNAPSSQNLGNRKILAALLVLNAWNFRE